MSKYPKVYLALDNCFALKRWVRPDEWVSVVREVGDIACVEASTDLEIDPQFCGERYRNRWLEDVEEIRRTDGIRVSSFFSGYATYRSAGFLNGDPEYCDHLLDHYVRPTIDMAARLGAAVGSTLQAFTEEMLENPSLFRKAERKLLDYYGKTARYAGEKGVLYCTEQMYTPTQGCWRINDMERYLRTVWKDSGQPFYLAIDTAHIAGHRRFLRPTEEQLEACVREKFTQGLNLPHSIKEKIRRGISLEEAKALLEDYEYWFASPQDGDIYQWLRRCGCYSPLMHLQQTDGTFSSHKPFTAETNAAGIIHPRDILMAIKESYDAPADPDMPPRVEEIYLSFELFFSLFDSRESILSDLVDSVRYFRSVIQADGEPLDKWI